MLKRFFVILAILGFLLSNALAQESKKIMTLEECIQIALRNNIQVIAAENEYKAKQSEEIGAWGNFLPRVDAGLGYTSRRTGPTFRTFQDPETGTFYPGLSTSVTNWSYSFGLNASQNIFDGGYSWYNLALKKAAKSSSYDGLLIERQNLVYSVKQKYFNVLQAKMLLEIQKDAVKRGEEQLKLVQARFDLGAASWSEVLKAKVQYGNEELLLVQAENNLNLANADLNFILAQDVNTPLEVAEHLSKPELEYTYDSGLKQALLSHPSISKAENDKQVAQSQLGLARSGLMPSLGISFNYDWANKDFDQIENINKRDYSWRISTALNFNIFDRLVTKTNISRAKQGLKTAAEMYEQSKNEVTLELKQAFLSIQEAEERIKLTEKNAKSTEEDLKLTKERYNLGAATILELLDSQVSHKKAQSDQVQALYDYNLAVARSEKAIGK